jgi:DNA-directed RNA polymerase specialized sigma24 family protein
LKKELNPVNLWFKTLQEGHLNFQTSDGEILDQMLIELLQKRSNSRKWKFIQPDDKVEILQEAINAVNKGICNQSFHDKIDFEKWVNRIVTFKFADFIRYKKRFTAIFDDNGKDIIVPPEHYPELEEYIERIIKELISDRKINLADAIQIYYDVLKYEDITNIQEEVASRLGISKRQVQRYRDAVRDYLKKKGDSF